jgi:hypothetical protein
MKTSGPLGAIFLLLACICTSSGQDKKAANPAAAPPRLLLLVHQEIQPGKSGERQKLEVATSRACDRLDVPNFWIDLQSLTGPRESLFFDPFDTFEHLEQSSAGWRQFYAAHPDLARLQEEIDALVVSERTVVAVRRDDLGYLTDSIDLSETRFMRVLELRLFPGHETDFVEAFKTRAEAYAKIKVDTPWVVYQVNVGMPSPSFLILVPMSALSQNDDLLSWKEDLSETEGEEVTQRLRQIAREAYASTESNLYAVSPEMSHVSREFAAGDPDFWRQRTEPGINPEGKPGVNHLKRGTSTKPSQKGI